MLFECAEDARGCEWQRLKGLVSQYDRLYGTRYRHVDCLDVSDRTNKSPEVLLESPGDRDMVIEHKIVTSSVGPGSYLHNHGKEHAFFESFSQVVRSRGERFDDSCYLLRFHDSSVWPLSAKEIRAVARQASEVVLRRLDEALAPMGLAQDDPFFWRFGPILPHEVDGGTPSSGIGMHVYGSEPDLRSVDLRNRRRLAASGYGKQFEVQLHRAAQKFVRYEGCRKVLAVRFCGDMWDGVENDELLAIVLRAELPTIVDQVWIAFHDWVSADDYEIGWRLVA